MQQKDYDREQKVVLNAILEMTESFHKKNINGVMASYERTRMYPIIRNHFLNMKRSRYETVPMTFEQFGNSHNSIKDEDISGHHFEVEEKLLIEEAKLS